MKAIIFDFDGTLANTLPICYKAFQQVFKVYDKKELSSEEIKAMFGPSELGIIRKNLQHTNKEQAIDLYYDTYLKHHKQLVGNNAEIDGLLKYLKETGYKIGVFTGKARRSLDISLKALHMDGLFDVIITGDDVVAPKPDPEGLIKALSILEVDKKEAIFIGDSDADIYAGMRANVFTVGVQWLPDYQTPEFTIEPSITVKNIDEFIRFLKAGDFYE